MDKESSIDISVSLFDPCWGSYSIVVLAKFDEDKPVSYWTDHRNND